MGSSPTPPSGQDQNSGEAVRLHHLLRVIERLRDPKGGCRWDRAQDHQSLRPYVLEESYELLAAVDARDDDALRDELGDLFLQVLLHARIAEERGAFNFHDVMETLASKLIRRHPHVFGEASDDLPSIRARWEEIKKRETTRRSRHPTLVRVRKLLSSLAERGELDRLDKMAEASQGETAAGLRLLASIGREWTNGFDPEWTLQKGLRRLEDDG